jgi:hypothetical protein
LSYIALQEVRSCVLSQGKIDSVSIASQRGEFVPRTLFNL